MEKIEELIAALEKAEGPSRELDFWLSVRVWDISEETGAALQAEADEIAIGGRCTAKPFTSSIDAAVALVERALPGWRIRTEHGENYSITEFIRGWGGRTEVLGIATSERADDHLALCICTSALRAKLSQEKNNADK